MSDWRSYDATAEIYERVWATRLTPIARDLAILADPPPRARILDVASGTGVTAGAFEEIGEEVLVVGVDRSPGMLRTGAAERPGFRVLAEVIDLPFDDGTFDVVACTFALHLFRRYETALFDMARVLKPGGTIAVATWATQGDAFTHEWDRLLEEVVGRDLLTGVRDETVPWYEHFARPDRVAATLKEAGFSRILVEKREYRFHFTVEEYVAAQSVRNSGRFARSMLGERGWGSFLQRSTKRFRDRFPDPLTDFNDVILACAKKR